MKAKITVLGCGNSTGIPAIGNVWGACDPAEPKNRRMRASIAVQTEKTTLIIDTGPDFREQVNRSNISTIDAVLYTHAHSDHIAGIDELRVITFRQAKRTPIYGNSWSIADLQKRYDYLLNGGGHELYPQAVDTHVLADFGKPVTVGDIEFTPFEQDHGTCKSVGYRFGDFGYSTDIKTLDGKAVETLRGIRTWMVDAAAYKQTNNAVHATVEEVIRLNNLIGAQQVWLTSLSLQMDYKTLHDELPKGYAPAWDGLSFEINL